MRGSEASRRSTRGDQAAVCVHIDTQSSGFGSDEAHFALQTGVECRAAEYELLLVRLRWRTHEGEEVLSLPLGHLPFYYSWNGGRAGAVCAGENSK